MIEYILSKVTDVNHQNDYAKTALMYYLSSEYFEAKGIILNQFIAKGLNPNLKDCNGYSLLTLLIILKAELEALAWISILCEVFSFEIALDILKEALLQAQYRKKEKIEAYLKDVLIKRSQSKSEVLQESR